MREFVPQGSIVRRIWGDSDLVLLIFAGAAAEFALNRAVDWLFATGQLPADPLGRLISTTAYAQRITFATYEQAEQTIASIRASHHGVEAQRGGRIPAWAHRDVLYLLADYSERAFHGLYRPLTASEQQETWDVFYRMGTLLEIPELPQTYAAWRLDRARHLQRDLALSAYTEELYAAYRRQLGPWRYQLMREVQGALAPPLVRDLLHLPGHARLIDLMGLYSMFGRGRARHAIQRLLIPPAYLPAILALDIKQ